MNLIEVVILAGVQCLSPVEAADGTTVAGKVPCAVLIHMNEQTGDVAFTPPAAATDPQVIASLVRREDGDTATLEIAAGAPPPEGDTQDIPLPAPKPQEKAQLKAVADDAPKEKAAKAADRVKPAHQAQRRKTASTTKRQRAGKRQDSCGSYKAVWYTNKEGRRKYRCVKTG